MNKFRCKSFGIAVFLLLICTNAGISGEKTECVILLHGLARTERSMLKLEHHLKNHGFHVVNIRYPSREKNIQTLSIETINKAIKECEKAHPAKIHFVTHSMGGILVRYYLGANEINNLGRVVMLSPPNQGSEAVDKLRELSMFKWLNGPAGSQLGTDRDSLPNKLSPVNYEVGVITGDKTINPILSMLIPGEDDGKVSVERAKLIGMKDFLVVHKAHPFIMKDKDIIKQVIYFIENGVFKRK